MTGKRHQEKAKQLLDLIWGNEDMLALFSRTAERAAQVVQAEVDVLRENTRFFGKYDSTVNIDDMDFNEAVDEVRSKSDPNCCYSLRKSLGRRKKEPSSVPLTLIASILSTRRAKQSKQETLVYTCTLVVSRRVISILQELRVIDCYRTILRTVQGIAANTEGRQSINLF